MLFVALEEAVSWVVESKGSNLRTRGICFVGIGGVGGGSGLANVGAANYRLWLV